MLRALLAGVTLGAILAILGAFATLRRMAFFGEGIAHASLAGIAIAVLSGTAPLPVALGWGILVAIIIFALERSAKLPIDTAIGILFTASMALGVILMSFTQGYQPELLTYLFGSILGVTWLDIGILFGALIALAILLAIAYRPLMLTIINEDSARVHGVATGRITLMLYIALAIGIVLGVKMLGIILVSALLIIPAATGRVIAVSLKSYSLITLIVAEIAIASGIILSAAWNRPTGACIVLAATAIFAVASLTASKK